jgi:hypothetical protein
MKRCCAVSSSTSTPPDNQLAELTSKNNSTFMPSWLVVGINNEKIVQGNYSQFHCAVPNSALHTVSAPQ